MIKKKKIIITGSNGLLGQKLVHILKTRMEFEVIATSKGENRIQDKSGYVYETLDITDKKQVEVLFRKHMPDTVINTAAMTNVDVCETDKEDCVALNISAVKNMVQTLEDLAKELNVKNAETPHFIHLSTDFIFDGEHGPYKEEDEPNPLSYYGWSKLESEKAVKNSSLKWCILRTIIVYGTGDEMSRSNIVLWAKDALEKKQAIQVVDDQFRSPTLAEDLAQACLLAVEKEATGIFHVSGKDIMSIIDIVNRVASYFHLDKSNVSTIKSSSLNQAAKRPPRTGFVLDKARKELGYEPHTFEEGLEILNQQLKQVKSK
ncbi:MAG: NAD(P)-dependent oxidoreductase [Bacteroidetes bacterium]|nr:NAD(P)-dependent oxidoreductase [Bacteroidota bacterium]HET6245841.1 NAD(P)-dependent oxidoreductase [Bacteroidia bacterium]